MLLIGTTAHAQNIDQLRQQAHTKLEARQFAEAIFMYDALLKLAPADTAALMGRGYANIQTGKYSRALADYYFVLKTYPTHKKARFYRAMTYNRLHRYTDAIADLDAIITADPLDSMAYNNRGIYKLNAGDTLGSLKDHEHIVNIAPENALYQMNLGNTLFEMGRVEEGLKHMSKAIALAPADLDHYTIRADAYVTIDSDVAAIADYDKALVLNAADANESADILYKRAWSKAQAGDHAGAIRDYNVVIMTNAANGWAYHYRALSKIAIGNTQTACKDFKKAKDLGIKEAKAEIKKNCK